MAPKKAASPPPVEEKEEAPPEPVGEQLDGDFEFQDKNSTYSGQYLKVNDDVCMHGRGTLITGPESFTGLFEKGQYKDGKYTACSGAVYKGAFRDNLFHGRGEYHWPDGRAYKGTWKDGYMHGRGQFMNFSFGVDKCYTGFSIEGRFTSNREEQEHMKQKFLAEYKGDVCKSVIAALKELGGKMTADGAPKEFVVPAPPAEGEESPESVAEREADSELVKGPFVEAAAVPQAGVQALVARLEPDAENSIVPDVLEERYQPSSQFAKGKRLLREQLQVVGQCVEINAGPDAEAGSVGLLVLVNVSKEYDIVKARWKVVHVEEVPAVS